MSQFQDKASDPGAGVTRCRGRVRVLFHGHLLADSDRALLEKEGGQARYFFPREDVEMVVLRENDHTAYDSGSGSARYFTIHRDGLVIEDIAWSYEGANAAPEEIRGMLTFDPDLVVIEADETERTAEETRSIHDYIRHTDSGAGFSQGERWEANVGEPSDLAGESEADDRTPPPGIR